MNKILTALFISGFLLSGCSNETITEIVEYIPVNTEEETTDHTEKDTTSSSEIPSAEEVLYLTDPVIINDNIPIFSNEDIANTTPYVDFEALDYLGRSGTAQALLDIELMPDKDRSSISHIYPSGWNQGNYEHIGSGGWLYNRSHLIGHQLTGHDNPENLITGTRQFNVDGMLPYENFVANHIEQTEEQVLYRVTPIYEDENLVAHGVQMEGYSAYDDGEEIKFNVFIPNVQDGITINYSTGEHTPK